MIGERQRLSLLRGAGVLLVMMTVPGCASSNTTGSSRDYPIVEPSRPRMQQPIRTPNGAVVTLPALPTINEADPSPSCERQHATFHDGSQPARRLIVVPPAPGLRAVAVTDHTTRLEWSFLDLPADCRPVTVLLSVRNGTDPGATPTTKQIEVRGLSGSAEITYPDFLPSPNVAAASAYSKQPHRSRTVSVLIERPANLPPNPPEAAPPVTAPAGPPITCNGPATEVDDPIGDILSYAPGSPPTQVKQLSPELSGIDITRAAAQIDGRTICATFVFARSPAPRDFRVTLTLRDTSNSSCCASLRFRRTAGRLEVGYHFINAHGVYELRPVENAGAALRDKTLVITGTVPQPSKWQSGSRGIPASGHVGWSATTGYFPEKYGPYYGDWLPRYQAVGHAMIRQRDGATVRPGPTP